MMNTKRWLIGVFLLFALGLLSPMAATANPSARYFPETGHTVQGGFLSFFDSHGGAAIFGLPLTDEILEGGTTVQYFERARFEWHPYNPPPYQVELGLLGSEILENPDPPVPPLAAAPGLRVRYFPETGHNVTNEFLDFWTYNGGLDVFGYPITERFVFGSATYQYFQRARFQWDGHTVTLGNLGTEWLTKSPQVPFTPNAVAPRSEYFAETGYEVHDPFLSFYQSKGGSAIFGFPISSSFEEGGRMVQYFQKARFEWHPEIPGGVQLGLLGQELHGPPEPAVADWSTPWNPNYAYFPETGHIVSYAFLKFFQEHGGLEIFGYPLSEAQKEGGVTIQWFQRARTEYRNGQVVLADLGAQVFGSGDREGRFPADGVFRLVWDANPKVQQTLGKGTENARTVDMAEQAFEHGRMFWRSDTNVIYILYETGGWEAMQNPYKPGDRTSWGYSPPAGKFEPVLGFGKVWRTFLSGPTGPLGWATQPQQNYLGIAQNFQHGAMLWSPDRWVYVLSGCCNWERYADTRPREGIDP
jgi:uncharacterized protein with LGFP repeats